MVHELFKKLMRLKAAILFVFLFFLQANGQEIIEFHLKWKQPLKVNYNGEETSIPTMEGQEPSN